MLLAFDLYYLVKSLFTVTFIPLLPILAGMFTAFGLLLIVYAEYKAREEDRRDHRRISRVSHQLEAPLSALETDLQYLMNDAENLPAEARLKLKHMETKTQVLIENIRDLFLMLQAQEHPVAKEVRTYDLCRVIDDVIETQQSLAQSRNIELTHKLHCETAPVRVDKSLLKIALNHIVENALTYTEKPGRVNIAIVRNEKSVRVIVQDKGIRITADDALAVWQPFARGVKASDYDSDGIGVGLTLSRQIVREFGGTLSFQNNERGGGTTFELALPLVKK